MQFSKISMIVAAYRVTGVFAWLFSPRLMNSYLHIQQRGFARKSIFQNFASEKGMGFFSLKKEETDPGAVKGTSLRILKYPHPKLRMENEIVTIFDEELKKTAEEMLLVMYAADGVGLAAPQVGVNKRLMVFNEDGSPKSKDKEMILVNPVIAVKSNQTVTDEEGCLSFPNIYGDVSRAQWIEINYQTIDGTKVTNKYLEGRNAIIFQHEYDHLDKILFIDRLSGDDREMNSRKLDKLIKKYGPGGAL